jgi:GDP-4-dehydro-6-deoxy-D-mannose reductase
MKVLVTGAGGFAGSHLVDQALAAGDQVVAMVRPGGRLENLGAAASQVTIERADLQDRTALEDILQRHQPERIFHLASLSTKVEFVDRPELAFEAILRGTFNLLCAWRAAGGRGRMLYVSSAEVYGVGADDAMPLREDHPYRPATPYASSKAGAEMFAGQFFRTHGLAIVRVRPFQHSGPRQAPAFVCSNLARQVAEIKLGLRPARISVGNLKVRRDFTDVRDVVRAYRLLLEEGQAGDVYQVCRGQAVAIETLLKMLLAQAGERIPVEVDPARTRSAEVPAYWGDASKTRECTGWEPEIPLERMLSDLTHYWEQRLTAESAVGSGR